MFVVKQEKGPLDSRTKNTMGMRFGFDFTKEKLCLDDRQLEQSQEERLVGLDIDPSLSWSSHIANLRKKTLEARCCSGSH